MIYFWELKYFMNFTQWHWAIYSFPFCFLLHFSILGMWHILHTQKAIWVEMNYDHFSIYEWKTGKKDTYTLCAVCWGEDQCVQSDSRADPREWTYLVTFFHQLFFFPLDIGYLSITAGIS